jgi:hypothetical protein
VLGFQPISSAPISARKSTGAVTAQPDNPFILYEILDEVLNSSPDLDKDASFYQQIDDDVVVAADTLAAQFDELIEQQDYPVSDYILANEDEATLDISFDLTEQIDVDPVELSTYQQIDDDVVVAPETLVQAQEDALEQSDDVDVSFYQQIDDDVVAQPDSLQADFALDDAPDVDVPELSAYQQIDDDAAQPDTLAENTGFIDESESVVDELGFYAQQDDDAAQPDTLFENTGFIDELDIDQIEFSSYIQLDDDVPIIVVPPTTGGGGRSFIISSADVDHEITKQERKKKREPFQEVVPAKTDQTLAELSAELFRLGQLLGKKRQAIKDRIKVEQAKQDEAKRQIILQLITLFELEIYNQNAARLLILLSEDRA